MLSEHFYTWFSFESWEFTYTHSHIHFIGESWNSNEHYLNLSFCEVDSSVYLWWGLILIFIKFRGLTICVLACRVWSFLFPCLGTSYGYVMNSHFHMFLRFIWCCFLRKRAFINQFELDLLYFLKYATRWCFWSKMQIIRHVCEDLGSTWS